jgi:hypothetical protein
MVRCACARNRRPEGVWCWGFRCDLTSGCCAPPGLPVTVPGDRNAYGCATSGAGVGNTARSAVAAARELVSEGSNVAAALASRRCFPAASLPDGGALFLLVTSRSACSRECRADADGPIGAPLPCTGSWSAARSSHFRGGARQEEREWRNEYLEHNKAALADPSRHPGCSLWAVLFQPTLITNLISHAFFKNKDG